MTPRDEFLSHWHAFSGGTASDPELIVQPFPGLRSFWPSESDLFFGRERQIAELLEGLVTRKVTFVLGGSGSGKSSLVRAGVMPRLTTAPVHPQVGAWYAVEFRPGEAPSSQLFHAIDTQILEPVLEFDDHKGEARIAQHYAALREALGIELDGCDPIAARRRCRDRLRELLLDGDVIDIDAVIALVDRQLAPLDRILSHGAQSAPPNLLVLIDQFEEVFENKVRAGDRDMLIALIKQIWKRNPDRLYLIVTMRSEELHRCSEFEGLAEVINASLYLVDLVGEADLVQAMEGPARRILRTWGLDSGDPFTDNAIATLQQVYRDSAGTSASSDRLPLIQQLLALIWRRAVQRWEETPASSALRIDVTDIQAIEGWTDPEGPLRGSLRLYADRVLKDAIGAASAATGIDPAEAENLIRAAFCTLARRDDRGNPKRDFATIRDMLNVSGAADRERRSGRDDQKLLEALRVGLELFRQANLLGVIREDGKEKYTVSHEAFIRGWREYRDWLGHVRRCADRLIDVDETLRDAEAAPKHTRSIDLIMEFFFADRLHRAALIVTEDTARLLEDVLGPRSTFSVGWARDVLARNDASKARLAGGVS